MTRDSGSGADPVWPRIAFQQVRYQSTLYYQLLADGWTFVCVDQGRALLTKELIP